MTGFASLLQDEEGATAIEYGLLVAMISLAIVIAVTQVSGELIETWTGIDATLDAALS